MTKTMTTTPFRRLVCGALFMAILAAAGLSGPALSTARAQEVKPPIILIINRNQILGNSLAGKDIGKQADELRKTIAKELQDEFDSIKKDEESLLAQQTLLAPEVLKQRAEALQARRQKFEVDQQIKNREFQASLQKATAEISKVLEPILMDILKERSASILLERSTILFADPELDITAEAMKRLDEQLKSVKLERVKIELVNKEDAEKKEGD